MRTFHDIREGKIAYTIIYDYPPNFKKISEVLPQSLKYGVIFTYGDHIYNPSKVVLDVSLLAHELTHVLQQTVDMDKDVWWTLYLKDPNFRYEQELEAHRVELQAHEDQARHIRRRAAKLIAERLASPLYGKAVTKAKAHEELTR